MKQYRILYNPLAGGGNGTERAMRLPEMLQDCEIRFYDITEIDSYSSFLAKIAPRDAVLIAGGDGTLAHFINGIGTGPLRHDIYYYPTGQHNDFWHDIGRQANDPPVRINRYLRNLPTVQTERGSLRVLNGVSNFTGNASGNSFFNALPKLPPRPTDVTVTVDGVPHVYSKVWLVPVTQGKFCDGMIPTPRQNRLGEDRRISVMILHDAGKLRAIRVLRAIFDGRAERYRNNVTVLCGNRIEVRYTEPIPIQVDGETQPATRFCRMAAELS